MPTIFSKIVSGEIPCVKVWENEEFLAFLDVMPITPGHTLVVPKKETDYFFDLDEPAYTRLLLACRTVAAGLKQATGCRKVSVCVFGFEVPHVHVHLIPMNSLADFPLPARKEAAPEELAAVAARIRPALSR